MTQKQFRHVKSAEANERDGSSVSQTTDNASSENKNPQMKIGESNFQKLFYDIQEDAFESSGDELEKEKNEKLLRLGRLAE